MGEEWENHALSNKYLLFKYFPKWNIGYYWSPPNKLNSLLWDMHVILTCDLLTFLCILVTVWVWNISLELMSFNVRSLADSVIWRHWNLYTLGCNLGTYSLWDRSWTSSIQCSLPEFIWKCQQFQASLDTIWARCLCCVLGAVLLLMLECQLSSVAPPGTDRCLKIPSCQRVA